jgi:HEPN domain-containing protein
MKQPVDLARRFLSLAERDFKAFRKLAGDSEIDDEIVGFHAQQTVEKCLKAVLAKHRVEVRKTHDLIELLALLEKNHLPGPPNVNEIKNLNPFAVMLRYDFNEHETLDRARAQRAVEAMLAWAKAEIR